MSSQEAAQSVPTAFAFPRSACAALDWSDGEPEAPRKAPYIEALRDGRQYVYFIGGEGTPVKVGFASYPHERLAQLQTAHWTKLEILAKVEGTMADERKYHRRFADARLHGEWFTRTPEIEAEIARLSTLNPEGV